MPEKDDLLVLIDGHALVHRAFHALPELTTSRGELVNAVFGFASMLVKVCAELKPRYLEATFDTPAKTFRHTGFDDYKATRMPSPNGLREQFPMVFELLNSLAVPIVRVDGFEADDVLGTLAQQAVAEGREVVILTGDTDVLQLVGPHVRVLTSRRGFSDTVMYDEQAVRERYTLEPPQIADYKALCGDTSDNIPGVPGIGPKTAAKLLQQFGTIDGILEHVNELPEKQRLLFEEYREQLTRSKWLATIVQDVPVSLDLEAAEFRRFDREKVGAFLREIGFRTLIDRFEQLFDELEGKGDRSGQLGLFDPSVDAEAQPASHTEIPPSVVQSLEELQALVDRAMAVDHIGLSVRIDGRQPLRADLVGLCLALGPEDATYVPVGHRDDSNLPLVDALAILRPMLEAERPAKAIHNSKPAMQALGRLKVTLGGVRFDSMVAAFLLESGQRAAELPDIAYTKLNLQLPSTSSLLGTGRSARTLSQVPIAELAPLVCAETRAVYRLESVLREDLERDELTALFEEVELPLVPVLARMEENGVAINVPFLQELSRELHDRVAELETQIEQEVGHKFNIGSPQQLGQILFDELKLPGAKRTKTGRSSTDANVLEELRGAHPVVDLVLEHRQLTKLKSTYVDALPALCVQETSRVHTSYNQAGAATGRLSSSDPNLQNIPIRTELGRRVRRAFVAGSADEVLLSADYSQIELRVLAHITQDERLVEAFEQDEDIHAATAAEVLQVDLADVTADQRRLAKVVNFGVLYGMSGHGLAQQTGLPRDEALKFIERYFAEFGTVKAYQDQVIQDTVRRGYGTTLLGRRRYIPEIRSPIRNLQMAAQRVAINMPIQGTAADVIKIAMIRLDRYIREHGLRSRMLLQVHDELVFEVPTAELDSFAPVVRELMQGAMDMGVPLKVDLKYGQNWDEMRPWHAA